MTCAAALVAGLPAGWLIADTAYDADAFRSGLTSAGTAAVIPSHPSRARSIAHDRDLYKERHVVECFFAKIKHFRRIATRYEKTAANFLAMVHLACARIWLR
jgi:transposase